MDDISVVQYGSNNSRISGYYNEETGGVAIILHRGGIHYAKAIRECGEDKIEVFKTYKSGDTWQRDVLSVYTCKSINGAVAKLREFSEHIPKYDIGTQVMIYINWSYRVVTITDLSRDRQRDYTYHLDNGSTLKSDSSMISFDDIQTLFSN